MAAGDAAWPEFDGVTLPEPLRAAAERELGETPARREASLASLRAKLAALPPGDVPEDLSDASLLRALRPRKFDVGKALDLLRTLQALRRDYPSYFDADALERARPHFSRLAACGIFNVLPSPGPDGHRVLSLAPGLLPEEVLADAEAAQALVIYLFWALQRVVADPRVQVHGLASLVSFHGLDFSRFLALNSLLPITVRLRFQRAFAVRYGPVVVYEAPAFVSGLFALVRPLLPAKLAQRVRFVGDAPGEALAATQQLVPDAAAPLPDVSDAAGRGDAALAWLDAQLRLEARGR